MMSRVSPVFKSIWWSFDMLWGMREGFGPYPRPILLAGDAAGGQPHIAALFVGVNAIGNLACHDIGTNAGGAVIAFAAIVVVGYEPAVGRSRKSRERANHQGQRNQ